MTFSPGGGSIASSSDVALNNPTEEQVLTFNKTLALWQNKTPAVVTVNSQSGTTYTLALTDGGSIIETTSSSAVTLTIPPNTSVALPVGITIAVRQYGTGQLTIAAGAGVTIRSRGSVFNLGGQYAEAVLTKRATDEWMLSGDLTA